MSDGSVQSIHTRGAVQVEFPTEVPTDPPENLAFMVKLGESIRFLSQATVYFRVLFGRTLLAAQQTAAWRLFPGVESKVWSDFMEKDLENLTGVSRETGYGAIQLAKTKCIASLPPEELRKFEILSNAFELAKLEKRNGSVDRATVESAKTMPMDKFREALGRGKVALLQVVLDEPALLADLQWIANFLKLAYPESVAHLKQIIERAKLRAGDNPNDTITCIATCCEHQWLQEAETEAEAAL